MFINDASIIIIIFNNNVIDQLFVRVVIYYDYFSLLLEAAQRERPDLIHQQLTVL